ncbi:MAG: hypothetical protein CME62_13665 [Halobacteriovoraceae bacterium]|nr:hypothetical protein [Halobacteriovoraceae bacterium]|tara:strand:+ start:2490 stop:3818 length:1329 start_codon:yes stop_codon:yes gene_type:complete
MKILPLGATQTVTGSKTLLQLHDHSYLIDCGLFQGGERLQKKNVSVNTKALRHIHAIFITHAHLDHAGYLPYLFHHGIIKPIYCTPLTAELIKIMLDDSLSILESQTEKEKIEGLYFEQKDIDLVNANIKTVSYNEKISFSDCQVSFHPNGHILGAASVRIQSNENVVLFSGDVGRQDDPLHMTPDIPLDAQTVQLEATYGDRIHSQASSLALLREEVEEIIQKKGVLLIPAFAIGRTQMILRLIWELFESDPHLQLPVFLDSPMGVKVTDLYAKNCSELKLTSKEFDDVLSCVKLVRFGKDVKKLKKMMPPFILVSSSGMLGGGKIMNYLPEVLVRDYNTVLLTGFQAEETLGRQLLEGAKTIKVGKQKVDVRARIKLLEGLSAHADRHELIGLVKRMDQLKTIILNHGESEVLEHFKNVLEDSINVNVIIAKANELIDLS